MKKIVFLAGLIIAPFIIYWGMHAFGTFTLGSYSVGQVQATQVFENKTIVAATVNGEQFVFPVYYQTAESPYFQFEKGEKIVFKHYKNADRQMEYSFVGRYSLPIMAAAIMGFITILMILFGSSVLYPFLSLLISLLFTTFVLFPGLLKGYPTFLFGFTSVTLLLAFSIVLSQKFTKSALLSAIASLVALMISYFLGELSIVFLSLFGQGASNISFIAPNYPNIDLQGVFIIGVYLGVIGIIDDVATAQTATIEELSLANPKYSFAELYSSGMKVGKAHIFSMINTLIFAYLGSNIAGYFYLLSLEYPVWVFLSSTAFTEEFIRMLIGSFSVVLAIPITSLLATWYYKKNIRNIS